MNNEKETYLTFVLGNDFFGVNVKNVLEVLEEQQLTKVPKAPHHISGIINFRGEILPVVNTRLKFNINSTDEEYKNIYIVYTIQQSDDNFSIAGSADGVKDVIEVSPEEINPVPEMGISYNTQFLSGVIKRDDKFILLINPEKVFSVFEKEIPIQQAQLI